MQSLAKRKTWNEYNLAIQQAVTPDDLYQVALMLKEMTLDGDVKAASVLFDRTMGKPKVNTENMDGKDVSVEVLRMRVVQMLSDNPALLEVIKGLQQKNQVDAV